MYVRNIFLLSVILFLSVTVKAQEYEYDFSDDKTGVMIYYNVTLDEYPLEASVTSSSSSYNSYRGDVVIPESVYKGGGRYKITSVWDGAFSYCDSLYSVALPNTVSSIGDGVFVGSSKIKYVVIPNSVTKIGNASFMGCKSLESVTFGESVKEIGEYTFDANKKLSKVIMLSVVPPVLKSELFEKINPTVYIPSGSMDAYLNSEFWKGYNLVEK